MKKLYTIIAAVLLTAGVFAQSPNKMSYQAVVRDFNGVLLQNSNIGMQINILQGSISGPSVYTEIQSTTTNVNGLLSIEIGNGSVTYGDIDTIHWENGPYFIKTETDPGGGLNYSITGTSQLMSVPYALYAEKCATPGPQGPIGLTGATGPQGPIGLSGNDGAVGPQGPIGLSGNDGAMGPQGPIGLTGNDGAVGPQGPIGLSGNDGAMGPQGPIGLTGNDGAVGPQGPIGLTGNDGAMGPQGPIGLTGNDGAVGPQGPIGLSGNDGAMGPQGPIGLTGNDGAVGPQGPTGLTGVAGINGEDGAEGPQGPQGPAGDNGLNGAVGPQGPTGLTGVAGINGEDGAEGPQGPQGPAGVNGLNGAVGPQGPIGLTGNVGATGPTGLLTSGSSTGVTPYWNGSSWVTSSTNIYNNGTSIGLGTSNPISSAKLDVSSTTQLFYPPRMTQAQRDAIVSPASGGMLFNTTANKLQVAVACSNIDNTGTGITLFDPIATGQTIGQTFLVAATNTISSIYLHYTYGTWATGDISCKVYSSVGGTLLATSPNTYSIQDFNYTFNFTGLNVTGGQTYYVEFLIHYTGHTLYHYVGTPYANGDAYYNNVVSAYDLPFRVTYGTNMSWENLH